MTLGWADDVERTAIIVSTEPGAAEQDEVTGGREPAGEHLLPGPVGDNRERGVAEEGEPGEQQDVPFAVPMWADASRWAPVAKVSGFVWHEATEAGKAG